MSGCARLRPVAVGALEFRSPAVAVSCVRLRYPAGGWPSLLHLGVIPSSSLSCHSLLSIARRSRSDFLRTCPCRRGGHEARWWDAKERFSVPFWRWLCFCSRRRIGVESDGCRGLTKFERQGGIGTVWE